MMTKIYSKYSIKKWTTGHGWKKDFFHFYVKNWPKTVYFLDRSYDRRSFFQTSQLTAGVLRLAQADLIQGRYAYFPAEACACLRLSKGTESARPYHEALADQQVKARHYYSACWHSASCLPVFAYAPQARKLGYKFRQPCYLRPRHHPGYFGGAIYWKPFLRWALKLYAKPVWYFYDRPLHITLGSVSSLQYRRPPAARTSKRN